MITDEMLMAYADGELDAVAAKRVERAMDADPALAEQVEAHRALRGTLGAAFSCVAEEPMPERLRTLLSPTVIPLRPRTPPAWGKWAAAMAASLVLVLGIGTQLGDRGASVQQGGALIAQGELARALDRQQAGAAGETRMLVSFQDRDGRFCRVFQTTRSTGIACREPDHWAVVHSQPDVPAQNAGPYRQAGSPEAAVLAEAQEMMHGDPLDAAAEAHARDRGWR